MRWIVRVTLSLCLLFAAYEGMVAAFHLLNQPSDQSVYQGAVMLALLCLFLPFLLWLLWRKNHDSFR